MRKLEHKTQEAYIRAVRKLANSLGRSPDTATVEDLRRFQLHLVDQAMDERGVTLRWKDYRAKPFNSAIVKFKAKRPITYALQARRLGGASWSWNGAICRQRVAPRGRRTDRTL